MKIMGYSQLLIASALFVATLGAVLLLCNNYPGRKGTKRIMKTACMCFNSGRANPEVMLVDIPDGKDLHEAEVEMLERRDCNLEEDAPVEEIENALRILGRKLNYGPRDWQEVHSFLIDPSVVVRLRRMELPEFLGERKTGVRFAIYDAFRQTGQQPLE